MSTFKLDHKNVGKTAWGIFRRHYEPIKVDITDKEMQRLFVVLIRELILTNNIDSSLSKVNTFAVCLFKRICECYTEITNDTMTNYIMLDFIAWFIYKFNTDEYFRPPLISGISDDYDLYIDEIVNDRGITDGEDLSFLIFAEFLCNDYIEMRQNSREIDCLNREQKYSFILYSLFPFLYNCNFYYMRRQKWTSKRLEKIADKFDIIYDRSYYWLTDGVRVDGIGSALKKYDTSKVKPVKRIDGIDCDFHLVSAEPKSVFTDETFIKIAALDKVCMEASDYLEDLALGDFDDTEVSKSWSIFDLLNTSIMLLTTYMINNSIVGENEE